jgi:HlyD family secretion protein
VVVTLQEPPENLRPGLSCTAKITTASRQGALAVPIQALILRDRKDLEKQTNNAKNRQPAGAPAKDAKDAAKAPELKQKAELQGVFVVRNHRAEFEAVETGVAGTTDIEVLTGIKDGDEIITGSYKTLRSLKNGASIKVNNAPPPKTSS